jgi:hypothetical protein
MGSYTRILILQSHCISLLILQIWNPACPVWQDCETFVSVAGQSPMTIAKDINDAKTHVAVNLDGWTSMGRTNDVFALTPAPVQVPLVVLECHF